MPKNHLGWASAKNKGNATYISCNENNKFGVYTTFRHNIVDKHQCVPLTYSRTVVKSLSLSSASIVYPNSNRHADQTNANLFSIFLFFKCNKMYFEIRTPVNTKVP